jgi:cobalt-precorrin-5B (C1)-methyltransferase
MVIPAPEIQPQRRPDRPLRRGWTTGACAAAAAKAAFTAVLTGHFPDPVAITLPKGERPRFALAHQSLADGRASASVIKDAGDDPDVTHGAEIVATVVPGMPGSGVTFRAGEGVGTVTRPGLVLAVGEPAINPGPRKMISAALLEVAEAYDAQADTEITIAIPGGDALATKTTNGRLGIEGGLSILGTTGIVIPYSCASWIHSIQGGIDVARAGGILHIAAATGRTSEEAARTHYRLTETALIDMGDFAGGLLKYLRRKPIERLTLAGGFAKLSKLAQGHLDLHSARSAINITGLTEMLKALGAEQAALNHAAASVTALGVLQAAGPLAPALAGRIAAGARETALATLSGGTAVDVLVTDRDGKVIGHAGP